MSLSSCILNTVVFAALSFSTVANGGLLRSVALTTRTLVAPQIDAQGRTAFHVHTSSPRRLLAESASEPSPAAVVLLDDSFASGLYFERHLGNPSPVAILGAGMPEVESSTTYGGFIDFQLSSQGDIALRGYLAGPGVTSTNNQAVFAYAADGSSRLVFRNSQQFPTPGINSGLSNFQLSGSGPMLVDSFGQVTLRVYPTGAGDAAAHILQEQARDAMLLDRLVPVQTMSRSSGDPPSVPVTLHVTTANIANISTATDGSVAFTATLAPPWNHNTTFVATRALVTTSNSGSLEARAFTGDTIGTSTISQFHRPVINQFGNIACLVNLTGASGSQGILRETAGELVLSLQVGDPVPMSTPGTTFTYFDQPLKINDRGDLVFSARETRPGSSGSFYGLFIDRFGSGILPVMQQGDEAPGTEPGTIFSISTITEPALNNSGQVAFYARLVNAPRESDAGIWATDRNGNLQLIVREGDILDVSEVGQPADLRTVSTLSFHAGGDGVSGSGFNDNGQVAFAAQFTDGTRGIFVSNAVAIPEPATVAILLLGITAVGVHRRARRTR